MAMIHGEFGALRGSYRVFRWERGHHTALHWVGLIGGDLSTDKCDAPGQACRVSHAHTVSQVRTLLGAFSSKKQRPTLRELSGVRALYLAGVWLMRCVHLSKP